jgi:hypothetical protein
LQRCFISLWCQSHCSDSIRSSVKTLIRQIKYSQVHDETKTVGEANLDKELEQTVMSVNCISSEALGYLDFEMGGRWRRLKKRSVLKLENGASETP